jgi:hypothetical protein
MVRSDVCRMHSSRVGPPNLSPYRNDPITRLIAGCLRFFTLYSASDDRRDNFCEPGCSVRAAPLIIHHR